MGSGGTSASNVRDEDAWLSVTVAMRLTRTFSAPGAGRCTTPSVAITPGRSDFHVTVVLSAPVTGRVRLLRTSPTPGTTSAWAARLTFVESSNWASTLTVKALVSWAAPRLMVAVRVTVASGRPAAGRVTLPSLPSTAGSLLR